MHNLIQDRLTARQHNLKQQEIIDADEVGSRVAASIAGSWDQLWVGVKRGPDGYVQNLRHFTTVLTRLMTNPEAVLYTELDRVQELATQRSQDVLLRSIPLPYVALNLHAQRKLEDDRGIVILQSLARGVELANRLMQRFDSAETAKEYFRSIIFKQPSRRAVFDLLTAKTGPDRRSWVDRIKTIVHGYTPHQLATKLAADISRGKSIREAAISIQPIVGDVRYKAVRIARTESLRVAQATNRQTTESLGDLWAGYQIRATLDMHTRKKHALRNGRVWMKESGNEMQATLGMEDDHLPDRPNCRCVGGKAVIHADVRWIMRSLYDGQAFEVRTRSGAVLTVTGNHPIATTEGFVAASQLREGDYVLSDGISRRKIADHVEHGVATVEDAFQSMAVTGGRLRIERPSPLEFHGDGRFMQGEIDIVGADLGLMFDSGTQLVQGQNHGQFVGRTFRFVRGSGLSCSLPFTHARPFEKLCVGIAANRDPSFHQFAEKAKRLPGLRSSSVDAATAKAVSIRQSLEGFPREITSDEVWRARLSLGQFGRFRCGSECDTLPDQPSGYGGTLYSTTSANGFAALASKVTGGDVWRNGLAEFQGERLDSRTDTNASLRESPDHSSASYAGFLGEFAGRFSSEVAADKIVSIRQFHWRTYVYSVDTGIGYYMGSDNNGVAILQGNCWLATVLAAPANLSRTSPGMRTLAESPIPDPELVNEWFAKQSVMIQRQSVTSKRYAAVADKVGVPQYADFIDPETGELLALDRLEVETAKDYRARRRLVDAMLVKRREAIANLGRYGFLP